MTILEKAVKNWKNKPLEFFNDCWPDVIIWDKLEEIINAVKDERRIAINSSHGVGKSWTLARIILWWLCTNAPSKVIITAPTWEQVRTVLFGEMKSAIASSRVLSKLIPKSAILDSEIRISGDWFAKGISTTEGVAQRDYGATKFQGFHSPNLLVVMDEAPGVDPSIHIGVENLATGSNNKIVEIGNPTSPTGPFYNNCQSGIWKNIQISAFDHPNLIQGKEVIPGCVTREWVEERKNDWGEDSPLYIAKVLGQFPQEGEDTVIPLNWILDSVKYEVVDNGLRLLGFDPARFGDDETTIYELNNNIVSPIGFYSKQNTMATTGKIVNLHEANRYNLITGDPIGIGAGIFDRINEINQTPEYTKGDKELIPIQEVNFAERSDNARFQNLRAEAYSFLADKLNPLNPNKIRLPNDPKLHNQLASIQYKFLSNGKVLIESKEEMKKRGLKSPDRADGVVYTVFGLKYLEHPRRLVEYQSETEKEFYQERRPKNTTRNIFNRL